MDIYTATEQAYKNGYEEGKKETTNNIVNSILHDIALYKKSYKSGDDAFTTLEALEEDVKRLEIKEKKDETN